MGKRFPRPHRGVAGSLSRLSAVSEARQEGGTTREPLPLGRGGGLAGENYPLRSVSGPDSLPALLTARSTRPGPARGARTTGGQQRRDWQAEWRRVWDGAGVRARHGRQTGSEESSGMYEGLV